MAEPTPRTVEPRPAARGSRSDVGWKHSIFAKLFITMLTMAMAIIVMMTLFLFFFVAPTIGAAVDRAVTENMALLVSTGPDQKRLRAIASKLDLDIRYQGPDGTWATDPSLPSFEQANRFNDRWAKFHILGRQHHVFAGPDEKKYLFSWRFYRSVRAAHDKLVLALIACIGLVVLVAHAVLRGFIRPVEWLREGFAQLRSGNLEVTVPKRSRDEFGVLNEEFNYMVESVREMVASRDRLLLDVSHELRSPLTRMKVALALSEDDEHKTHLLSNVAEMETLVSELLELERLRGARGLRFESCDICVIIAGSIERFHSLSPGIRPLDCPKAVIHADPQKLRTVFDNVLDNAIKYSHVDSRPVEVSVSLGAAEVEIRIDDDGQGIPEADRTRVFEPFFRVDRSRSRKTGGFGLGLSLCERIVHAHRGRIEVHARPTRGTSCVIVLPVCN